MKRFLYIALLLNFIVLLGTGVLRFWVAFDTGLSRLHVISGLLTGILILLHLADKARPLWQKILPRKRPNGWHLTTITALLCAGIWYASWNGLPGVSHLMRLSYEQRNHAAIFRSQDNVAHRQTDHILRTTKLSSTGAALDLKLYWQQAPANESGAAIAIWAETKSGSVIETLYLTGSLKYSEQLPWEGKLTRRGNVLPVWRHRYTAVCGVDPHGNVDLISRPTINHQWLLDQKLDEAKEGFVLFVEINHANDNAPSRIYAANIEPDAASHYALLNLLGHSGGSENDGELNYDLTTLPSTSTAIDYILVKTKWQNK